MHLDPIMPYLVGAVLAVLVLGLILRSIRQPYVIAYLIEENRVPVVHPSVSVDSIVAELDGESMCRKLHFCKLVLSVCHEES